MTSLKEFEAWMDHEERTDRERNRCTRRLWLYLPAFVLVMALLPMALDGLGWWRWEAGQTPQPATSQETTVLSAVLEKISTVVGGILVLVFLVGLYFLPTIVAHQGRHHNAAAIGVLNFFLGWTFLGWVIALVWSCTARADSVYSPVPVTTKGHESC